MSWAVGYDDNWKRDIGYGVPSICDHPECNTEIDRGLGHVCGGEPYGGEDGCGLFFCDAHGGGHFCERCNTYGGEEKRQEPFDQPTPDTPEWMRHKLRHESWWDWRKQNPKDVENIRAALFMLASNQSKVEVEE